MKNPTQQSHSESCDAFIDPAWGSAGGHPGLSALTGLALPADLSVVFHAAFGGFCVFDRHAPRNGLHRHNHHEICLVLSGSGEYRHGEALYPLQSGDVFLANPDIVHEIRISPTRPESGLQLLYFLLYSVPSPTDMPILPGPASASINWPQLVLLRFAKQHRVLVKDRPALLCYGNFFREVSPLPLDGTVRPGITRILETLLLECLDALAEPAPPIAFPAEKSTDPLAHAMELIRANPSMNLTLTELAAAVHTSPRTLQRQFEKSRSGTFLSFRHACRMQQAASLLRMNFRVAAVGTKVGIPDPARFSKCFSRYWNISPKRYQSTHADFARTEHLSAEGARMTPADIT